MLSLTRTVWHIFHHSDVIMSAMTSQITCVTSVYLNVCSGADQRKPLCEGNSPVTGEFHEQRASNAENVSLWWRHHGFTKLVIDVLSLYQILIHKFRVSMMCDIHIQYEWLLPLPMRRHQMETFSALLAICAANSPVDGEFPSQRPVTRSFDVFFDLRLNKRLSKQWWCWWFETQACPLWRHCNAKWGFNERWTTMCLRCNVKFLISKLAPSHVKVNTSIVFYGME